MSGPFGSSQWMYSSGAAGFYDTEIDGSLRFNDDDSAYLTRTPSTAGNRRTWTFSAWVKRGRVDNANVEMFGTDPEGDKLSFTDSRIFWFHEGSSQSYLSTTALFRDPSAWYHIVLRHDTTQATNSNRIRLYVNGVQVAFDNNTTWPSQNYQSDINNTQAQYVGRGHGQNGSSFDGYMADVYLVDGSSLDATSFGETKSGVWIPKAYSGSYGTNGFHLEFAGNANDSSGNGNNWTANNISSYDYVPDSPTNNFATLNPLGTNDISSFSQGNLKITTGSGASSSGATMGMSSGKWYAEFVCTAKSSVNFGLGITKANTFDGDNQLDEGSNVGYFLVNNANVYHGFASDSYGASFNTGDVMGIAFDADTLALQWYKNGVGQGNYTRVASENTAGDHWIFGCGEGQGGATATFVANFGQDSSFVGNKTAQGNSDENGYGDFYYTPPSGYLALCTANLPDPVIDPAQGSSPEDYFNTVLYSGTSSTNAITGVGFQPDWTWLKVRSTADAHRLIDAVRGDSVFLASDNTGAEANNSGRFVSFDSDGFTVASSDNAYNNSSHTYVAWNWKANGSGVSNTVGSIPSTVSANTTSGFSIVTYTGNGTNGATVGHGLSQAPEFVIVKPRDQAENWNVQTDGKRLNLNLTGSAATNYLMTFNSDTVTLTDLTYQNGNGYSMLMYAFHSVEGFSKFGSYTGNGSSDGPFVYTGFRPAFVITKPINTASSWCIHDSERTPANTGTMGYFKANTADAENFSRFDMDLLSNGFKIKSSDADVNHSGGRVIYWAFAENPFKYANAR